MKKSRSVYLMFALVILSLFNVSAQNLDATDFNFQFESLITPQTTDKALGELKKGFSTQELKLEIDHVKRNDKSEIISISLAFISANRNPEKMTQDKDPIDPINVYVRNFNGIKTFGFEKRTENSDLGANPNKSQSLGQMTYNMIPESRKADLKTKVVHEEVIMRGEATNNMSSLIDSIIITKNCSDQDLNRLRNELSEKGIILSFSGIKRNKSNQITKINIHLTDQNGSRVKKKVSQSDSIDPISIGLENGKVMVKN